VQIHDLAFDRASSGISAEAVDTNSNSVCVALHHALIGRFDEDYLAIGGTDHAERDGWHLALWITEYEIHEDEQRSGYQGKPWVAVSDQQNTCRRHEQHGQDAFLGNKWISSSVQSHTPREFEHGRSPAFAAESIRPLHGHHTVAQKQLECAADRFKVID
jgi:hypothetical protein